MTQQSAADAVELACRQAIEEQARSLIIAARAAGYNVEIAPRPLQPLAMRHYELAVTIWPVRTA